MRSRCPCRWIAMGMFLWIWAGGSGRGEESSAGAPVTLKVGHVGHDHHVALYVAADKSPEYEKVSGLALRPIADRKRYELTDRNRKLADVEIVVVGGGAKMPTALAQGVIDMGLGGTAAVLAAVDNGAPVRLIAPLHFKGDMFVVKPDFPAKTWAEFVAYAKEKAAPVRIGYKDPEAVAKIIFERALQHEGLTFSGDMSKSEVDVHMVNVKGGGKLNVALGGGLVDGYVGNNPFPAIGVEKGICRVICDLETLPPGDFRDHPCCCVGANKKAIKEKREAVTAMLGLLIHATATINSDTNAAVQAACRWIGTSEAVERASIPTSGYSMEASAAWHGQMGTWLDAMNGLESFSKALKGKSEKEAGALAYDLSLLEEAERRLRKDTATK